MNDTDSPEGGPLHLGRHSPLPASPEEAVLDYVANPRTGALYCVRFAAPVCQNTSIGMPPRGYQ